ncbi:MAG TPA: TolC family protein [Gemmatimonadaceae bacterium]|nr:TolC family protein [Gemmatimonadaceae bacterium]
MSSTSLRITLAITLALCAPLTPVLPRAARAQRPDSASSAPRDSAAPHTLSLADALRLAEPGSEEVLIARAGVMRARGEIAQARSAFLPQLVGTASYTRTLKSEFQGLADVSDSTTGPAPTGCGSFTPNPGLPLDERVDSLEHAVDCTVNGNPFSAFGNLPFGQPNQFRFGLSLSQNLFTGGRITNQLRAAHAGERGADLTLTSARAQLLLDVTQAYYDAALSERLYAIAQGTLEQTETTLRHTQLARQVGTQPEFELLRAQVARDNQRPVVIQQRAQRDIAMLRLKQMLNLPLDDSLALTTPLADTAMITPASLASLTHIEEPKVDTSVSSRAPVRAAEEAVDAQRALLAATNAQRIPSLTFTSQYGRVAYPSSGLPAAGQFRTNWTIELGVQVPLFTGGRIHGERMVAAANLDEARARLNQTREQAALDTRDALAQLQAAEASFAASTGTEEQAARAYQIANVRYTEGISTQTELADARLLMQQAQANRAMAARDLQVARMRVLLLKDLPLGGVTVPPGLTGNTTPLTSVPTAPVPQQTQPTVPTTNTDLLRTSRSGVTP